MLNQFEIFCNSRWIHGYNLGLSTSIRSYLSQQIICKVMRRFTNTDVLMGLPFGRVVDLGPLQYDFVGILTVLVFYVYTKATVILRREFRGDLKPFS